MSYLLDTNTCVQHLRGRSAAITGKLASMQAAEILVCSVVRVELLFGALRSADPPHNQALVEYFCARFVSLPFDDRAADAYAMVRATLTAIGQLIGPNDLIIAAIALVNNTVLVTHNTREFSRVAGLITEDWEAPSAS